MNKRQAIKEYRKELALNIRFDCINWRAGKCDVPEECTTCGEYYSFRAQKAFRKMLKKEGISVSGWRLAEIPATGVYIFYNGKKRKEITLETGDNKNFAITVYDFNTSTNIEYPSMATALKSRQQMFFYAPELHKGSTRKVKKQEYRNKYLGE